MKEQLQQLTWKQKNLLLIAGLLFFAWIVYAFALSRTIEVSAECTALQMRIDSAADVQTDIEELEVELARFNQSSGTESHITHEQLLDLVSSYCNQHSLLLRDFPAPMNYRREEWMVEIHRVTVQGSYVEMVQLLEFLRREKRGKVVSVDFVSKTDNKTKVRSLLATIYVQCISEQST